MWFKNKKAKEHYCYGTVRKECNKKATHVSEIYGYDMYVCEKHAKYLKIYFNKWGVPSSFKRIDNE